MNFAIFTITTLLAQNSPHIDRIKKDLPIEEESGISYTEQLRQKQLQTGKVIDGEAQYTNRLKRDLNPEESDTGYSEKTRLALDPEPNEMGAIEAVQKGKSELKLKRSTDIHSALGIRFGASVSRAYVGQGGVFGTFYPSSFNPDLSIHYEWKLFHSEWFGSLGLVGEGGIQTYRGFGMFKNQLRNPVTSQLFPLTSHTSTQLMMFPVVTGLVYRFNLLRVIRPFVQAGPMALLMAETRSDSDRIMKSYSTGLYGSGGVSILLDGINREMTWDLYSTHSVKHYYLTAEYMIALPLTGDVQIRSSGIYAGLLLEM